MVGAVSFRKHKLPFEKFGRKILFDYDFILLYSVMENDIRGMWGTFSHKQRLYPNWSSDFNVLPHKRLNI
jgi:hypothetical protein